jgi:hypothetical protein
MINESKIRDLIKRQKETGLTISAFCSNEGIPKSSYYYWRKKLSRDAGKQFIPLLINPIPTALKVPSKNFTPDQHEHPTSNDTFPVEISYPNGTTVRLKHPMDLAGLRSLVTLID